MSASRPATFGMLLKRLRRAAGLTQEELAARAGYTEGYVGAIERDIRRPLVATAEALADALRLDAHERAALLGHVPPLRGATPAPAPAHLAASGPLIGRRSELARLDHFLAGEGPPLLLLAGEPGIGKSRLLQEAAARGAARGWTVQRPGALRPAARRAGPLRRRAPPGRVARRPG